MIQLIAQSFRWIVIINFIGHLYGAGEKQISQPVVDAAKAVVSLQVTQINNNQIFNPFSNDPTFGFFFGRSMSRPQVVMGSGSGVIVDKDGLIVTCAHVIDQANKITVLMDTGQEFDAKILYQNMDHDIAFIQIQDAENQEFPYVHMGDAHTLTITEPVYAIGNAFNMGQSVTNGIISATNRIVDDQLSLQTDTAVNPGNSGGGLFDKAGNYIGLPNAILTRTGANHGVGFAKPVNLIKSYMHRLRHKTLDTPPWLGINGQDFTYQLSKALPQFKASKFKGGVLVTSIHPESPLINNIQPKDIILSINDYAIGNMVILHYMIDTLILGQDITIALWRDGKIQHVKTKTTTLPVTEKAEVITLSGQHILNGCQIAYVNEYAINRHKLSPQFKGQFVIVSAPQQTTFAAFNFGGVQEGDMIISINDHNLKTLQDVEKLSKNGIRSLRIKRGQGTIDMNINS